MLSGDAAEGEDGSEREEGQSPLSQPSGTTLSQPMGTTLSQPSGTTLSQPSGTTLSQPSGTQSPLTQPSGKQSPSCPLEGVMASPAPASAPYALLHRAPSGDSQAVASKEGQGHFSGHNVFQRGDKSVGTNNNNTDRWKHKAKDRGEHGQATSTD